ncbi:MAG: hypothetical protein JWM93_1463, partial [Frankiales bacterium]|nr:hypothetical protein [Frankiales bacterium]
MLDAYARKARLFPAALAALPALVLCAGAGFLPSTAGVVSAAAVGACGVVLCGFVRDAGRAVQAAAWASSGGSPTLRAMRFSGAPSSTTVERLHARVTRATDIVLPSAAQEREDPKAADELYGEAITALRELTRDAVAHPLVAVENTEYGFRRNCFGLK